MQVEISSGSWNVGSESLERVWGRGIDLGVYNKQ